MDGCSECSQHNQKEKISEAMCTTNRCLYFTKSEQQDKSLLSDCPKVIKASDNLDRKLYFRRKTETTAF